MQGVLAPMLGYIPDSHPSSPVTPYHCFCNVDGRQFFSCQVSSALGDREAFKLCAKGWHSMEVEG